MSATGLCVTKHTFISKQKRLHKEIEFGCMSMGIKITFMANQMFASANTLEVQIIFDTAMQTCHLHIIMLQNQQIELF
jgi:hypothetical protein